MLLLAESKAQINHRVTGLPQVIDVPVPMPDAAERERFLAATDSDGTAYTSSMDRVTLARMTAGLSLQALRQLTGAATHLGSLDEATWLAKLPNRLRPNWATTWSPSASPATPWTTWLATAASSATYATTSCRG